VARIPPLGQGAKTRLGLHLKFQLPPLLTVAAAHHPIHLLLVGKQKLYLGFHRPQVNHIVFGGGATLPPNGPSDRL
jgi:hypothetical protein